MGGKGGGGSSGATQTTSTVEKADPWSGVQPYLQDVYARAQGWMRSDNPQYFPESTIGPQAPETLDAQALMKQRAVYGSPLEHLAKMQNAATMGGMYLNSNPAQPYWNYSMGGNFLNSNPYIDATFNRAVQPISQQFSDIVMPGIASQFSAAGRYGSGAHQDAMQKATQAYGRTLSDTATELYGGNYFNERQLQAQDAASAAEAYNKERFFQDQAASLAPQLANIDYQNINALATVGAAREARAQDVLNEAINRWNYSQAIPLEKIQAYNDIISGGLSVGGQRFGTSTAPSQTAVRNPLMGALGGGMMGYQLGGMLGGASSGASFGPWGALAGAVLGGLFS